MLAGAGCGLTWYLSEEGGGISMQLASGVPFEGYFLTPYPTHPPPVGILGTVGIWSVTKARFRSRDQSSQIESMPSV